MSGLLRIVWSVALVLAASTSWAQPIGAEAPPDEKQDRGEIEVSVRWRYEKVGLDGVAKDAHASTLRSTLAYRTPFWNHLGAFAEFEDVHDVGLEHDHANGGYGSLDNLVTGRPVIPDPELTELNQAYVSYRGVNGLTADAGRMEIRLADERFVGPVGFRQNHQSFDGARLTLTTIPRTTLFYGFIGNVNRINGGNHGMESHILDAAIDLGHGGKLAPYVFLLDYDDLANAGLSTKTYGARWDSTIPAGSTWSIPLHAQAAMQHDTHDNPNDVDAHYWRLEGAFARKTISFGLGWEVLGGDPADGAFQTPLATLHKFNGSADLFLTTPPDGLVDVYATISGTVKTLSWSVMFHDFESDAGSTSYGTELDAELIWTARWKQSFGLNYASYDADDFASDTDKLWLFTSYRFGAKL